MTLRKIDDEFRDLEELEIKEGGFDTNSNSLKKVLGKEPSGHKVGRNSRFTLGLCEN